MAVQNSKNVLMKKIKFASLMKNQQYTGDDAPFQRRTHPSSPEEAKMVPVAFQQTRQTVALWSSNWPACRTSKDIKLFWACAESCLRWKK